VETKTATHPTKRDKYGVYIELANNVVEDWIARKYIPTIKEFAPYTSRDIKNMLSVIAFRSIYVKNISWAIITCEIIQDFVYVCRKLGVTTLVDAGCGHGVLAHALREKGLAVDAINADKDKYHEIYRSWGNVIRGDAVKFIEENVNKFDGVILSWPPYDESFATEVVNVMRTGQLLFYCGEGRGGCTGDKYFHGALDDWYDWGDDKVEPPPITFAFLKEESERINKHFLQFLNIHDRWRVYIKK